MKKDYKRIANLLFEVGILAKTPRSGFYFLGSGEQSVAEHVHRVIYVGFTLALMEKDADMEKVLLMCLFHDLAEARTSDLNYVHQKYIERNEEKAISDLSSSLPFGDRISKVVKEYEDRKTIESIIAKDADNLDWILSLKEQYDIGNTRADDWIKSARKRLKTDSAKKLAEEILQTNSDEWWFGNKEDEWWVSRNKK